MTAAAATATAKLPLHEQARAAATRVSVRVCCQLRTEAVIHDLYRNVLELVDTHHLSSIIVEHRA